MSDTYIKLLKNEIMKVRNKKAKLWESYSSVHVDVTLDSSMKRF